MEYNQNNWNTNNSSGSYSARMVIITTGNPIVGLVKALRSPK